MATLPEGVGVSTAINYVDKPTNTFIAENNQIVGMDSGLKAMRQAVDVILNVERFRWQIYNSNFGSELEDLVGEEYDYIVGEIPRRIEEAFSVDNRILSAENFQFSTAGTGSMTVTFDVITVYGAFSEEVTL